MFCDYAKIKVIAGAGGDGTVSFLHDINKPKAGPDGGDGGRGGDIIFQVDPNLNTLSPFLRQKEYRAPSGQNGAHKNMTGRDGANLIIKVPLGTIIYEINDRGKPQPVFDFHSSQFEHLIAAGGRGGLGNTHFTSSTRQAPRIRELGLPGEKKKLILELKTIADVGLVGLPNCGKSTFLSVVTAAKPKIADYPFTTITPNLGVIRYHQTGLTIADIPGLIAGASQGRGLGHKFLKHIERTRIILHFIDIQSLDPDGDYWTVRQELKKFSSLLDKKKEIICFTKLDTTGWDSDDRDLQEYIKLFQKKIKKRQKIFAISAATHQGIDKLLAYLFKTIKTLPPVKPIKVKPAQSKYIIDNSWRITSPRVGHFLITGAKIEQIVRKTDFDSPDSAARFNNILIKTGIEPALRKQKVKSGDSIQIGPLKFTWGTNLGPDR
ncbi:MAG: GTPase ObgE [Patescibacteria group bacterium]